MNSSGILQYGLVITTGLVLAACSTECPNSARYTTSSIGPGVRYDLVAGIESVPWPNDSLCWLDDADPGPCLPNLPTAMLEPYPAGWVRAIDATRGWSTNGPIVVPFSRAADVQSGSAVDLARLLALQQDNDWSNDAIYLVDLETGLPHTLDFPATRGSFILHQPIALDPSDVRRGEPSLTVETIYEGLGSQTTKLTTGSETSEGPLYRQDWDTDSDGTLDVPVLLPGHICDIPTKAADGSQSSSVQRDRCLADELVDAYDSAKNTLRIYPRTPLAQGRRYAVVIMDRLVDNDERPVQSPFSGVSHPRQVAVAERVLHWLGTPDLARYYGPVPEDITAHVRFVWGFTTGAPSKDLRSLFRRYQPDFFLAAGSTSSIATHVTLERQYALDASCSGISARSTLSALMREVLNLSPTEERATVDSYGSISSVVVGTLSHPTYPDVAMDPLVEVTSHSGAITDIPFWLTVPKTATSESPLRIVVVSHEQGSHRLEGLRWAGHWASLGLATLGFDRIGTDIDTLNEAVANAQLQFDQSCTGNLYLDLMRPRSDSHTWHANNLSDVDPDVVATRRRWRLDAIELATIARCLKSSVVTSNSIDMHRELSPGAFFGVGTGAATAALAASLAPGEVPLIMVDPATSPERAWSRGATWGAAKTNLWHVFGPRLAGVPAKSLDGVATRCNSTDSSIRLVNADTPGTGIEVGCLPLPFVDKNGNRLLNNGATAIATNLSSLSRRCVAMTKDGHFSMGLPAAANDAIELSIYDSLDVVIRLGRDADCALVSDSLVPAFVLGSGGTEESVSSILTTAHGLGLERQSSELLHALDLAASAFTLANPAPFVADLAQPIHPTDSRGVLLSISSGDTIVPNDEGLTLARAARLIPRFPPENLDTYWELAADTTPRVASALTKPTAAARVEGARLDEGVPRLSRFPPNKSNCGSNVTSAPDLSASCPTPPLDEEKCSQSLPDLDALAGTEAGFGAVQPIPSLRLARYAGLPESGNLTDLWSPQSRVIGPSVQPSHPNWPFVAMALPLANPWGSHGIPRDDLCQRFRFGTYLPYLFGQFIATGGTDYAPVTNRETQQCLAQPSTCTFLTLIE